MTCNGFIYVIIAIFLWQYVWNMFFLTYGAIYAYQRGFHWVAYILISFACGSQFLWLPIVELFRRRHFIPYAELLEIRLAKEKASYTEQKKKISCRNVNEKTPLLRVVQDENLICPF